MPNPDPKKKKKPEVLHPGSSADDAKAVGGKGDFGVPESNVPERTYTSKNTKMSDPGNAVTRSGTDGSRTSGVGGNKSGDGSSSGGDVDPQIVGVGTGGGVSASGKIHEPPGPDDATGSSQDFASGPPGKGANPQEKRQSVKGSTVQPPDEATIGPQGADAAPHTEGESDAFSGEVSSREASGQNDAGN